MGLSVRKQQKELHSNQKSMRRLPDVLELSFWFCREIPNQGAEDMKNQNADLVRSIASTEDKYGTIWHLI
jgi:hypothetical protein